MPVMTVLKKKNGKNVLLVQKSELSVKRNETFENAGFYNAGLLEIPALVFYIFSKKKYCL